MKAYKASYNQICQNQKYEPEETYTIDGSLKICVNGFHFCYNPDDVLGYYEPNKNLVIFEVEPLGEIITQYDKSVTDKIKITRIIPVSEWNDIFTKYKFDDKGNMVYKNSYGFEYWYQYDQNNNLIHIKDPNGYETWKEFDEHNNLIHIKTSYAFKSWYDNNIICQL